MENGKPDTFLGLDRESKLSLYEVKFFQRSVKLSVLRHGKSFRSCVMYPDKPAGSCLNPFIYTQSRINAVLNVMGDCTV